MRASHPDFVKEFSRIALSKEVAMPFAALLSFIPLCPCC